jgi:nucleotide-binding universal stress UspA family protein
MSDISQFNQPKVAVAVAFDENAEGLVRLAGALARRLGKKLVLLHAVEPWIELPASLTDATPLLGLGAAAEREAHGVAEARLKELAGLVPHGVEVERVVVLGKARSALAQSATACNASLLIVGAHLEALRHAVPRGLSTAMALMPAATVPLLVVDPAKLPPLAEGDCKLLVADDLSAATAPAVRYALELAAAMGQCTVRHVYVNGIDRDQLQAALAAAAAASHSPLGDAVSPDEILNRVTMQLQAKLEERASAHVDYLEAARGRYEAEVVSGSVRNELLLEVLRYRPHLLVFGRHKTLHTGPMFLGRMPFRAMVAHGLPVLIVPEEA